MVGIHNDHRIGGGTCSGAPASANGPGESGEWDLLRLVKRNTNRAGLVPQLEEEERLARSAALILQLPRNHNRGGLMPIPLHLLRQHEPQAAWTPENRFGHAKWALTLEQILQLESHIDESA